MLQYKQSWSAYNPVSIYFGLGSIAKLPKLVGSKNVLLITSPGFRRRGVLNEVSALLKANKILLIDDVQSNPDIKLVEKYRSELLGKNIEMIVGLGGGSVLDTAKALSYLLKIDNISFSLKSLLAQQHELEEINPLPFVAIPTTAGTGSEVTPFSTIWDKSEKKKHSLSMSNLHPTCALLDPELTTTLPESITVNTGLDILSHALESIWNKNANPLSIQYASNAISLVLETLPALTKKLEDLELRSKMLNASLLGGLSINITRTALAHSISYPITARFGVPHGLACSFTLPALLEVNSVNEDGRFSYLSGICGYSSFEDFKKNLVLFFEVLEVKKRIRGYNIAKERILDIIPEMFTPERAGNNLIDVDEKIVHKILEKSLY